MTVIIECIVLIGVIIGAIFATRLATHSNEQEELRLRGIHQKRKLQDLKEEIEDLYRKDLTGVLRFPLSSDSAEGYLVRYKFYLSEMVENSTIDEMENLEIIPELRLVIERLIAQVNLQEKIDAICGDSVFPEDSVAPLTLPDLAEISVDDIILSDIKHDFQLFEKHFHEIYLVKEHEPESVAENLIANLPEHSTFTYFFDEDTFYIIASNTWGVFIQEILEQLNCE
ncbi:hypothetical protein SAMN02745116_00720 [Pilibacter termitis]|jgi:hypothetical protein|uniref:Uncharacterized protein n=1 Tax=Pilibacter termitis TaxID=263852 RepID=A0A1T4LM92_9ENTE|nr:hypothetical protein [Pilibacter termitis]SJZ55717.1 hypothetical protein SAMN02745116_00720 [Pilibacter termitis]